eukprot:gene29458-15508_t
MAKGLADELFYDVEVDPLALLVNRHGARMSPTLRECLHTLLTSPPKDWRSR